MPETLVGQGIRCLLFDLGDTLWYRADQAGWSRREDSSNRHAIELLRRHISPTSLPLSDAYELGQRLRQDFDRQVRATIGRSPLQEPDVSGIITRVLQEWGIPVPEAALAHELFDALRIRIPESRTLFSDVLPTLAELRQRGFLLGVVTNRLWGGKPFYEDLRVMGLLDYFWPAHIAISGDLGIRKPNPAIFEYALHALQVTPGETAMVGDSLSADILGAQPLGMCAIWKPKTWLRDWALEHTAATQSGRTQIQLQPVSTEAFPGIDTADTQLEETGEVPAGMYVTDDDYILARARGSWDYLEKFRYGEIRPNHVIGHLADLLEIFTGAGES